MNMDKAIVIILPVLAAVISLFVAMGASSANAQTMMGNQTGTNMTSTANMTNSTMSGNMTGSANMTNSSGPMMSNST
jgi:hypothetical protein